LKSNFTIWCGLTAVIFVAVALELIIRADRRNTDPIITEIYNSGTGDLSAYVYATNAQHRFENGKVEESWLTRPVDVPGATPVWTMKPHKARVVWR
jgi:hypothetical protein